MSKMWAYQLVAPGAFQKLDVLAPEASELGPGQVLVRLTAAGICGSDLRYFRGGVWDALGPGDHSDYGGSPAGMPLHEIVGTVLTSRDDAVRVGASVVGWAGRMDGLTEYVVTDGSNIIEHDPTLPPTTAIMLQPLACVIAATHRLARLEGSRVAVLGLGPIGILFAHVAKTSGASWVLGIDRVDRADLAGEFLLDEVVHASCDRWISGLTDGNRPQVVIEAIGHQISTLGIALSAVAPGGEILYFGGTDDDIYPISMRQMLRKNLTLISGTTTERKQALALASEYVARYPRLLDAYVTDVLPIDEVQAAFERAIAPSRSRLKIVLGV